jgi:pyruvate ferredoxin oxidoreductase beta subunit
MNKELARKFSPGHTTCAGCAVPLVVRMVLNSIGYPMVVTNATGCMEVVSTIYPNTSWKVPYLHSTFVNAGATVSGIETAYKALKKKGEIKSKKPVKFIAFGGDGGTYDIGLQALSGALERHHDFLYICYDNGAYMNTGNQRSGATPLGADTETTPFGKDSLGKKIPRKNIMSIVAGHDVPYLATANIGFLSDLKKKVKKAMEIKGPKFLLVFSPCVNQWKYPTDQTIKIAKLATETNFWPLYEVENGNYVINYVNKKKKSIEEFYKTQGRFRHLFKKNGNKDVLKDIQSEIDGEWRELEKGSGKQE